LAVFSDRFVEAREQFGLGGLLLARTGCSGIHAMIS
jgi:hypothetical protein